LLHERAALAGNCEVRRSLPSRSDSPMWVVSAWNSDFDDPLVVGGKEIA